MKTKTKIQTKKSTAVSAVSIEGHPVPTSSPSKVLGGLLSFSKGDIVKTQSQRIKKLLIDRITATKKYLRETKKCIKKLDRTLNKFQTWPWDTITFIPSDGGPLRICGTDIAVIYDREAKVYRRDPNPVKPSEELAKS